MSSKLSFRERVERQARTAVKSQAPSYSPVELRIDLPGELSSPVTAALLLRDNGLGLAKAHAVVTELTDKRSVVVNLYPAQPDDLLAQMRDIGLVATLRSRAQAI